MSVPDNTKPNVQRQPGIAVDALELWASEAPQHQGAPLSLIKLEGSETLIVPFTTMMVRYALHYLKSSQLDGYVHCLGQSCLLCQLGIELVIRDLLPVYDPVARTIGVLAVTPNKRVAALQPQLTPRLQRVKAGERLLVGLRKLDNTHFAVSDTPLPNDADDGAEQIATLMAQMKAGSIDLGSVFQRLPAADLVMIPEIAARMQLKGIKLP